MVLQEELRWTIERIELFLRMCGKQWTAGRFFLCEHPGAELFLVWQSVVAVSQLKGAMAQVLGDQCAFGTALKRLAGRRTDEVEDELL